MPAALVSVSALLLGAAILLLGNGLVGILMPVRATLESFATTSIGLIASGYSAGFVVGCLSIPHIVRRVGHIRTFAVMAAIAASVVQLMALLVEPLAWILLRMISGVAFAGLYMVIESWLNERASNTNRGQLFAAYMVIQLAAITAGQMLLPAGDAAGFGLFAVAAIAITLALVPVGLTTSSAPQPLGAVHLRLGRLYRLSPVGVLGCFFVGLANGAFGGLGVVFAQGVGLGTDRRRAVHERRADRRHAVPGAVRPAVGPDRPAQGADAGLPARGARRRRARARRRRALGRQAAGVARRARRACPRW